MARYGTTSVSSLLSAAKSSASAYQALQDQEQQFNWEYGPQDQAAFDTYNNYLKNRINTLQNSANPADQEKAISYTAKTIQAQRTFNTNQVQNEAIQIMQGNATNTDKLNLLRDQLVRAVQSGADPQTIQGLQSLYDHQAITVTNENITAQNQAEAAGRKAATTYAKTYNSYEKSITDGIDPKTSDPSQMGIKQLQAAFENGKIGVKEYANQLSQRYSGLQNLYSSAANDQNLDPGTSQTWNGKLSTLQQSKDFMILNSPQAQQALSSGENPFVKVRTDDGRGWTIGTLDKTGQTVAQDSNGQTFIKSLYALNKPSALKDLQNIGKTSNSANYNIQKGIGNEQEQIFKDSVGDYYIDPDTGKKVFIDPKTGVRALADPNNPNVDTSKVATAGGHSALSEFGTGIGSTYGQLGHEIASAASGVGHGISNLLSGGVGKLLNPVESALHAVPQHPSQVASTFNNMVSTVQRALTGTPAPAQPKLPLAPMPVNTAPYAKSVLYTPPTPYPSHPTPAQQNTNTVSAINNLTGFHL